MRAGSNGRGSVGWRTACALLLLVGCSQDVSVTDKGEQDDDSDSFVSDAGTSRVDSSTRVPDDDDSNGPVTITPGKKDCNQLNIAFGSPRPTVFILVDRSSSMFEQNFWNPLKAGVLQVVKQL